VDKETTPNQLGPTFAQATVTGGGGWGVLMVAGIHSAVRSGESSS